MYSCTVWYRCVLFPPQTGFPVFNETYSHEAATFQPDRAEDSDCHEGCYSLFEQSSGVGSREAQFPPINGWQVHAKCLTAYTLLKFTFGCHEACTGQR